MTHIYSYILSLTHTNMTDPKRSIFVRNLSFQTTINGLKTFFAQYGPIKYAEIAYDTYNSKSKVSKGYGFVTFEEQLGAWNALIQPEKMIDGRCTQSYMAVRRSPKMFDTAEEEVLWLLTLKNE